MPKETSPSSSKIKINGFKQLQNEYSKIAQKTSSNRVAAFTLDKHFVFSYTYFFSLFHNFIPFKLTNIAVLFAKHIFFTFADVCPNHTKVLNRVNADGEYKERTMSRSQGISYSKTREPIKADHYSNKVYFFYNKALNDKPGASLEIVFGTAYNYATDKEKQAGVLKLGFKPPVSCEVFSLIQRQVFNEALYTSESHVQLANLISKEIYFGNTYKKYLTEVHNYGLVMAARFFATNAQAHTYTNEQFNISISRDESAKVKLPINYLPTSELEAFTAYLDKLYETFIKVVEPFYERFIKYTKEFFNDSQEIESPVVVEQPTANGEQDPVNSTDSQPELGDDNAQNNLDSSINETVVKTEEAYGINVQTPSRKLSLAHKRYYNVTAGEFNLQPDFLAYFLFDKSKLGEKISNLVNPNDFYELRAAIGAIALGYHQNFDVLFRRFTGPLGNSFYLADRVPSNDTKTKLYNIAADLEDCIKSPEVLAENLTIAQNYGGSQGVVCSVDTKVFEANLTNNSLSTSTYCRIYDSIVKGVKVSLITAENGYPISYNLVNGAVSDTKVPSDIFSQLRNANVKNITLLVDGGIFTLAGFEMFMHYRPELKFDLVSNLRRGGVRELMIRYYSGDYECVKDYSLGIQSEFEKLDLINGNLVTLTDQDLIKSVCDSYTSGESDKAQSDESSMTDVESEGLNTSHEPENGDDIQPDCAQDDMVNADEQQFSKLQNPTKSSVILAGIVLTFEQYLEIEYPNTDRRKEVIAQRGLTSDQLEQKISFALLQNDFNHISENTAILNSIRAYVRAKREGLKINLSDERVKFLEKLIIHEKNDYTKVKINHKELNYQIYKQTCKTLYKTGEFEPIDVIQAYRPRMNIEVTLRSLHQVMGPIKTKSPKTTRGKCFISFLALQANTLLKLEATAQAKKYKLLKEKKESGISLSKDESTFLKTKNAARTYIADNLYKFESMHYLHCLAKELTIKCAQDNTVEFMPTSQLMKLSTSCSHLLDMIGFDKEKYKKDIESSPLIKARLALLRKEDKKIKSVMVDDRLAIAFAKTAGGKSKYPKKPRKEKPESNQPTDDLPQADLATSQSTSVEQ